MSALRVCQNSVCRRAKVRLIGSHSNECSVNCEIMLSKTFCFVILVSSLSDCLCLANLALGCQPERTEHTFKVFVVDLQVRAGLSESSFV